jgi:hypothetical protein
MADTIIHGSSGEQPALGYDSTTRHAPLPFEIVSVAQDITTGQWYGSMKITDLLTASQILGKAYSAMYLNYTVSAEGTYALAVFNPANSGKNCLVFSAKGLNDYSLSNCRLSATSSDPAYMASVTPLNMKAGGSVSAMNVTASTGVVSGPPDTSAIEWTIAADLLTNGTVYMNPPGYGIIMTTYVFNTKQYSMNIKWLEL